LAAGPVHVVVVDPLPLYRHGIDAVLSSAGYAVETPSDLLAWLRQKLRAVVLLTLISEQDWQLLHKLGDRSTAREVIALVPVDSAAVGVRAVRAGAQSVLLRTATPAVLVRAVEATIDGQAVMPASVAAALASGVQISDRPGQPLSPSQLSWLRQLAAGSTVAQLATDSGYSDRAMFRRLRELYHDMGVRTRVEAIVLAQGRGWLDLGDTVPPRSR
jgi:DNA-binding NarL/FixJ family response regulator